MNNRSNAVRYAETVILGSTDWQQVQDALSNHPVHGPWIEEAGAGNELSFAQLIIREAEENLGERLPAEYA